MKTSRILVLVLFLAQCMISPIDNMDSRTLGGALYRLFPFLLPKKSSTPPSVIATNAIVGEEKFAINRKVYAIFNKEVRLSSDSALEIFSGKTKISGKTSVEKNTIKFIPDSLLPKEVKLTATIYKNGIADFDSNSMESDFSFSFETGSQSDLTPPLISSISPLNGASSVGTNTQITIEFSETMELSTLASDNLELYEGTEKIPVTISYAGNIVLLKSSRTLAASGSYVINVKKAVQDSAGNSMSADFTSTFTTGSEMDLTVPKVAAVFPSDGSVAIPIHQKGIILIFSEVLDPLSVNKNSIQIQNSLSQTIAGSFVRISNTVVFYPRTDFDSGLTYTVKVNKELKDLAGNSIEQDSAFTFSTVSYVSLETTPLPTFSISSISSNLTNGQTDVNPFVNINLNFPETIDPASVNGSNVTLVDNLGNVLSGTFSFTNNFLGLVFDPSAVLSRSTAYTLSVLEGIRTLSGRRLSSTFTLSFTTGTATAPQYTIGGSVSGLVGSLSLQNNSTNTLTLTANGNFTFTTALDSGSSYSVSVLTQPSGQTCSVSNGSGTLTSNVANVAVTCVTNSVTSSPSALTYAGGPYTFTQNTAITPITPTVTGTVTSCTVTPALPTGLSLNATTCAISGTPTVTQTATNHTITASNAFGNTTAVVGITVNLAPAVATPTFSPTSGTYTGSQSVTISSATAGNTIRYTTNGSDPTCSIGTVYSGNVTVNANTTLKAIGCKAGSSDSSVASSSYTIQYIVGGTVSGLVGTVVLQNNAGNNLSITANGAFTFSTPISNGSAYSVTVFTQPAGQSCSVSSGGGTIGTANITSVSVSCTNVSPLILGRLRTGQTTCYDGSGNAVTCTGTHVGQDGKEQRTLARNYTDNGNGTITDNATGLVWQKCNAGQVLGTGDCRGTGTNLNNYGSLRDKYDNAVSYCDALTFAGSSNWRLPTIKELSTLLDAGKNNPAIDTVYFLETALSPYVSSTASVSTTNAWEVNFAQGIVRTDSKTLNKYVRCVSGPLESTISFTDNGDGTVTDSGTNLVWQKCSRGQNATDCSGTATTSNWQTAISYCNSLNLASKTWRLPNRNELQSIIDHTVSDPSIHTTAFPNTQLSDYWSSTTHMANTDMAWSVRFSSGSVLEYLKTLNYNVRCVSGP